MKIGIDLDDTICRTTEMVGDKMEEYAEKNNIEVLEIMNDEGMKFDFFNEYLPYIYKNVQIKRNVKDVIRRLKNKGNQIFLITARTNSYVPSVTNVADITEEWLKDNEIEVDDKKQQIVDELVENIENFDAKLSEQEIITTLTKKISTIHKKYMPVIIVEKQSYIS